MMGNWELNLLTNKYICSDGFFKIMGYKKDETNPSFVDFLTTVHPDDKEKFKFSAENSYKNKKGYSIEFRIIRKDGELRYVKAESLFTKDSDGNYNKAFGTIIDLTELKINKSQIRESEERLKQAETIARIGYWSLDHSTQKYECSDGFCKICGLDPKTFKPSPEALNAIVHLDDKKTVCDLLDHSFKTGENYNLPHRIVFPDGTIRHINTRGTHTKDKDGILIKTIGTIMDITDFMKKDEELRANERRLKYAEKSCDVGHWEWDRATNVHIVSDGLFDIIGYKSLDDLPSREFINTVFHKDDRKMIHATVQNSYITGNPYTYEARAIRPSGEIRYVKVQGFPFLDKNGK